MYPEIHLGSFQIPSYILYLSVLYCGLVFYAVTRAKRKNESVITTLDLALILMLGGFVGARLAHVLYESPETYADNWIRIFQFWQGGFVFYGGFLLALIGCWIYLRRKDLSFFHWADFFAPIFALGYGLGRMSCFLAGCCYGSYCEQPWAVTFQWDQLAVPRHPTQLYAVIWELAIYALLIGLEKKSRPSQGKIFSLWILFHGLGRLMMEHYREDFRGALIAGLTISTWISLALISTSTYLLITRPKR
ncbi:MAG: prolipoprotein diacylglyceryl transferase [Bdellovibrio sp. CG10_big_fil_rev_8_21_14_0_10_47_8]|nr:MAG: prolipoprotein diacylglyceryl transferase [Bdellovibrio sp. CG10_big_fil_rev_8_21_14_0_10_47_8]